MLIFYNNPSKQLESQSDTANIRHSDCVFDPDPDADPHRNPDHF